MLSLMSCF